PAREAEAHIFGYTIFNDFSARDRQAIEMQGRLGPAKGKSFDGGNVLGPWIVTRDEIPEPFALQASVRVNGELRGRNDGREMIHSFAKMIAYVSEDETLHPGEIFGSGTYGGCCGMEIDRFLGDGDVVELEIEKIGTLRSRVVPAERP
ncbi:MAG TPA: fumarylacetoacetate hydrolase family protein, partial [Stellaceae bacterium]|nr:fumarylacetoacetate hydrolase family protein [Stellaceae bacterium]